MVAIPLIWSGPRSSGALDRLAAWLERSVARSAAAESVPAGTTSRSAARRPEFLEHAAMSRELHRL